MKNPMTTGLENFAEALERAGVEAEFVEVSLPLPEWQALAQALEAEKGETVPGDIGRLEVAGINDLVRFRP